jgi:hypothetical protein
MYTPAGAAPLRGTITYVNPSAIAQCIVIDCVTDPEYYQWVIWDVSDLRLLDRAPRLAASRLGRLWARLARFAHNASRTLQNVRAERV